MGSVNYLLGATKELSSQIARLGGGGGKKKQPYTFEMAKARLTSQAEGLFASIQSLPDSACPDEYAVGGLTVHPEFIAKSYFPDAWFSRLNFTPVGSRSITVIPAKVSEGKTQAPSDTFEVFFAGKRTAFQQLAESLPMWIPGEKYADSIVQIEALSSITALDRIRVQPSNRSEVLLEIVLHMPDGQDFIVKGFKEYLQSLGIPVKYKNREFSAQGLHFLGIDVPAASISKIAEFSFLRVLREMPTLRPAKPFIRNTAEATSNCTLPQEEAAAPNLKIAVFDGGLPIGPNLGKWVKVYDANGVKGPSSGESHGLGVTSALLFGHINLTRPLEIPPAAIDHYRIFDDKTDPQCDLLEVLGRITDVIDQDIHEFFSLSLGPDIPAEDDHPHVWTSVLDSKFSSGDKLMGVAVGNSGELSDDLGLNRVQPPSDCVNVLAIGACDSDGFMWQRAPYSSVGRPGKRPGLLKPDMVSFGGYDDQAFTVLKPSKGNLETLNVCGTSFATPSVVRAAASLRAYFGTALSVMAIKAILLHRCERSSNLRSDVGFGRLPSSLSELMTCTDNQATIVFQGKLEPGKMMRLQVPFIESKTGADATLTGTLCYSTHVDPAHPMNYTRAGVLTYFRPDKANFDEDPELADIDPFFGPRGGRKTEAHLRGDEHKWQTTLHAKRTYHTSLFNKPIFDICYVAREGSGYAKSPKPIRYAFVLSIQTTSKTDLYNEVVRRYPDLLTQIRSVIQIPIRTRLS